MTTWRARLGVLAVFVAGFLGGGVTLMLWRAHDLRKNLDHPEVWAERVTRHLGRRLSLSPAQLKEVRTILDESRAESAAAMKTIQPQMVSVFDRTHDRIAKVLDAKQRSKFEEISARRRVRFLKRFSGDTTGPPIGK